MRHQQALAIYKAGQDVVVKTLCDMDAEITSLNKTIKSQEITIAKLSKNSSNSGKRPSSDDITKPKSKKGKKRKIGGQLGHPRHERPVFPEEFINAFHDYELDRCPICNGNVIFVDAEPRIIQQVELKEVTITTQEHRSYAYWCEVCQKIHYAPFPAEVVKEGLFKARATAVVAYMSNVCHASFSTIRKFFRDIIGIKVSRGYLAKIIQKVSMALEKPYEELLDRLPLETTLNVDETGHKENGDKFWTWVFKAELYVLFRIDKSRGSNVLIDVLGKEFNGVLGCDYFSAYRKYMKNFDISIQFCIAHLIRDIKFLAGLPDTETKAYGQKLLQNVKDMFKIIHEKENLTQEQFNTALEQAKGKIITVAIGDAPSCIDENGKEEKREAQNMANRFRKHGKEYFTFITTPGIGPTNNLAEQAIRFVVIDRHVTQGTRSIKGRKANERLWTVIATCSLQGRSAFDFILKAVTSYFNGQPPPSLLPEPADTS
ncbi:MAG: IS66 family transposase [Desulfobacterales bacterium]|nr:IS66 family transposase [Desulfobacterales bacterium]